MPGGSKSLETRGVEKRDTESVKSKRLLSGLGGKEGYHSSVILDIQ